MARFRLIPIGAAINLMRRYPYGAILSGFFRRKDGIMTKRVFLAFVAAALMVGIGSIPAYSAAFSFTGVVTEDFGNPFGLNLGDAISGSTFFEDGVIDPTALLESHLYDDHPTATLEFNIGNLILTEADDPLAAAFFSNGDLTGFDYLAFDIDIGGMFYEFDMSGSSAGQTSFTIFDEDFNEVLLGNFTSLDTLAAQVPEPSVLLLLGTGLIGLAGAGRRLIKH